MATPSDSDQIDESMRSKGYDIAFVQIQNLTLLIE